MPGKPSRSRSSRQRAGAGAAGEAPAKSLPAGGGSDDSKAIELGDKARQTTKQYISWLGGVVYADALSNRLAPKLYDKAWVIGAIGHVRSVMEGLNPRDPAEEMLAAQLALTHSRILHLTSLANQQKDVESIRVINEYIDRACNTYRRLMLALAEYRRPPRQGDAFTAIRQMNLAGQQVVQNHGQQEKTPENGTNEQGCPRQRPTPEALPADAAGIGVAPFFDPAREALEACLRPAHTGGKGTREDERPQAR